MELTLLIAHVLNFAAPALVLALCLPLAGLFLPRNRPNALVWYARVAIIFASCLAVLLLGLVCFGRDGKMASYALMVLVGATFQAWLGR